VLDCRFADLRGRGAVCESAKRSRDDDQHDERISAWVGDDTGPDAQETVLNGSGR
jgi:hypothetical protein